MARYLPAVKRQIAQARDDTLKSVYADMAKSVQGHEFAVALPEKGLSRVNLWRMHKISNRIFYWFENPLGRTFAKTSGVSTSGTHWLLNW